MDRIVSLVEYLGLLWAKAGWGQIGQGIVGGSILQAPNLVVIKCEDQVDLT